mmetsp:Transcript_21527/g.67265  ORF Transcript_21527/g.67265 Transcript_21527/m.67265 type:complete len:156 (+) Transcript_21527:1-468(+)
MLTWLAKALPPLSGSSDTALGEFLYSLSDESELRSYAKLYLGESAAVGAFVNEFIERRRRAEEGASFQPVTSKGKIAKSPSAASTPGARGATGFDLGAGDAAGAGSGAQVAQASGGSGGKGKKNKKGKKVDLSLLGYTVESSRIMKGEIDLGDGK